MKHLSLRNILVLILSLGLGTAVLGQSDSAAANDGTKKTSQSSKASHSDKSAKKAKDFQKWTQSEAPGDNIDEYAKNGLTKLDDALGAVVEDVRAKPMGGGPVADSQDKVKNKEAQSKLGKEALNRIESEHQKLSQIADDIGGESEASENSEQFHEAATSATQVFSSLQEARFPDLKEDVDSVKNSADKLDASQSLSAQNAEVEDFFKKSSAVIDQMSENLQDDAIGGGPSSEQENKQMDDSEPKPEESVTPEMK